MTFNGALNQGRLALEQENIEDAKLDAWLLLSYLTGMEKSDLLMKGGDEMPANVLAQYEELIAKRAKHIPLQQLTGVAYFYGLEFEVNEHVLTPRADTETLIETALPLIKDNDRILDMCTGSGCILLTLLTCCSKSGVQGVGADISREALAVAKANGTKHCKEADFIYSDLFTQVSGKYNMIVSNPPYINTDVVATLMPEVRDHEPHLALDGGEDGMIFYNRIVDEAPLFLYDGGWLIFEIGYDQGERVSALMEKRGFKDVKVIKDLCSNDRVVIGHL